MTEPIPNWMQRFIKQDLSEEKEEFVTLTKLLDYRSRNFIWWMCREFSFVSGGVMGQSCSLLERFIARLFKSYSYMPKNSAEWCQVKEDIAKRIPLLACVCIGLTTKMMSSERQVHAQTIRRVLSKMNLNFTLAQVNKAEMDVLSRLDFQLPLFTNVEKSMMMAADVGMSGEILEAVTLVTDVAEYYRPDIQRKLIELAFTVRQNKHLHCRDIANVRHIHLVAGCVIATGLFMGYSGPDPLPRLCFLTESSQVYLKCIGDIIHARLMIQSEPKPVTSRKRKLLK